MQRLSPSTDIKSISFGETVFMDVSGMQCIVTRCGYTGEDGFEVFAPGEHAVKIWQTLKDQPETRLAALGARDALRLEAGLCLYGHDLDEETTPTEAALTWVVAKARRSGARANFVGHEKILEQVGNLKGMVKHVRIGLRPKSGPPAREGAAIETLEGEQVGIVTSGTMSPCLRKNIAMGYVNKPFNKTGTELNVVVRDKRYPAEVCKMPFVPTQYYKPA